MMKSDLAPAIGVVLLGGAHGALALARAFGRLGVPVAMVTNDHPLPKFSRYIQKRFAWLGPDAPDAVEWLLDLASTQQLTNWMLIPGGDAEVRLIASQHHLLGRSFQLLSSRWDNLKKLCDKQLLAAAAAGAGVTSPKNYRLGSEADAASVDVIFPVVLKPAMRTEQNAFTQAKAWRADTREDLIARYRDAAALVGAENVVVQEFVPGDGDAQLSYAALWHRGAPVAEMTARRARQYPIDFSYTSTFVEVAANAAVAAASIRLLSSIEFEGLVEVEYKFDARDGSYKILDVNPRSWTWIALCEASGLQLAQAIHDIACGRPARRTLARPGHAWIHTTRDFVAALQLMIRGRLSIGRYLKSLQQKLVFSTFAWADPLPGILDIPLTVYRVLARRAPRMPGPPTPAKSF